MERIDPHHVRRGNALDELRFAHPAFIAQRLQFGRDLSVEGRDVAKVYTEWLGVKDFAPADVGNLYALLMYLGVAHNETTRTFHGVGLRAQPQPPLSPQGGGRGDLDR